MNDWTVGIDITESAGLARFADPVRVGVPLPRGALRTAAAVALVDAAGTRLPLQTRALARWSDGSIQWLLLDTTISCDARAVQSLQLQPAAPGATQSALAITESANAITVNTDAAVFQFERTGHRLVAAVTQGGHALLTERGIEAKLLEVVGQTCVANIRAVCVEEQGDLRCTVRIDGHFHVPRMRMPLEFLARVILRADSALLEIEFRLRNPQRALHPGGLWDLGDPGSVRIRDLSITATPARAVESLMWRASPDQALAPLGKFADWTLYQDSSGGERWSSPNHLAADGKLGVTFSGFRVTTNEVELAVGKRATPLFALRTAQGQLVTGIQEFWQNFPKSLRLRQGEMQLALFPHESRWPAELQGGEQKRHTVWFDFTAAGETSRIPARQQPLEIRVDPQAIEASGAVPYFTAPRADDDARQEQYVHSIVSGDRTFFHNRELIDEYGWRNFGDLYADHEAVRHTGTAPFVSHYNNQYDFVQGALLRGLRSGDVRWLWLMRDLARHVIDIDIYHTQQDKAAFNGGLFWHTDHYQPAGYSTHRTYSSSNSSARGYGGGPANEHNYTSGLLGYYYLTGDADAAEAVRGLADFAIAIDDGSRNLFALIDSGPTGDASKTVSSDFHKPGRGAGNSINALLDAYSLTRERAYLAKAQELIERCIHPRDDVAALKLGEPEHRWSYLVFLQVLARFLERKLELGETDYHFHYARESLLHYADWMLAHEVPYQDVLHKVELPTETWPAQDVRKAHVLYAAARFTAEEPRRSRLMQRGEQFFQRCLTDLLGYPTAWLTRPRVILSVYGNVDAYYRGAAHEPWREMLHAHEFGEPVPFLPQKRRLAATLRRRVGAAVAELSGRVRERWAAVTVRKPPRI